MNEALRQTAIFVRDLLDYDEALIRIGRLNSEITDFETAYIGVDSLGAAQRLAGGESYNGDTEVMNYAQQWRAPVTLSFYGATAWTNANKFAVLLSSQAAHELQETQGIAVYKAGGLTDIKILTGQQYGERLELTLNVIYSVSQNVDTLRIDEPQFTILTEEGTL